MKYQDIHCENCGRFLGKLLYGVAEYKCPVTKCKAITKVKLLKQDKLNNLTLEQILTIIKA